MEKTNEICVPQTALDSMMPMHVLIGADETIKHVGPTLAKTNPTIDMVGKNFFEIFEPRRPYGQESLLSVYEKRGAKVYLKLCDAHKTQVIGRASILPSGEGILLNLSFGISVLDAVGRYNLAGSDFAPTDLTLEMLYLVEAKSAAMAESSQLNKRLHGAKKVAEAEAASDMLTGLCNRRVLDQVLGRLVSRQLPFTLLQLDLDFFKAVNDTLGHAAGDHVLKVVSEILAEETRAEDTVARVGGDEFVLIFDHQTDPARVASIAGRIIKRLEVPIDVNNGAEARISGSIGFVCSTSYDRPDADQMMADADAALYASKERGRACYTMFERGKLIADLKPVAEPASPVASRTA